MAFAHVRLVEGLRFLFFLGVGTDILPDGKCFHITWQQISSDIKGQFQFQQLISLIWESLVLDAEISVVGFSEQKVIHFMRFPQTQCDNAKQGKKGRGF